MEDNFELRGIPPKVKIFTCRLATNSLAVQVNRSRIIPNVVPICTICGMVEEDGYHATMSCTKAKSLRQGLSDVWNLLLNLNLYSQERTGFGFC
jgi:hypothetical protein